MKKPHDRPCGNAALRMLSLAAPAALLLTGCAGTDTAETQAARGCPDVSVLRQMERTDATTADGASATLAIQSLSGECAYTANAVTVDVDAVLAGERSSGTDGAARVSYFVAVVDPQQTILNKEVFQTDVPFDGTTGIRREQLRQVIPLPNPAAGMSYQVIFGFQP
ncbi:hypothetical protein [Fodinicurvata sp. EGI_FJ10296]|uniref:hypothetical protein n=1 Tax=Fodinicurvata sp. EGI_FJ10296 TaxID=3231908 RepID=UPI003453749B